MSLPPPLLEHLAAILAADLRSAMDGADPSEDAKPSLRTLTWLDESTLVALQREITPRLGDPATGTVPTIAVAVVSSDETASWFRDGIRMRIDEAHEFRDKPASACRVLCLLIPAHLETNLRRTGLDNPASPISLNALWTDVIGRLRDDLASKAYGANACDVADAANNFRPPRSAMAEYLAAILASDDAAAVGRELWRLGLIPDVGDDAEHRLPRNRSCVDAIASRQQAFASLDARLEKSRVRRGPVHAELKKVLGSASANPSLPVTWLPAIANEHLSRLSFHLWDLEDVESSLETIHVKSFLKADGSVVTGAGLQQPGGPNTPLIAHNKVRVGWTTTPLSVSGVTKWRLELVAANPDLVGEIPELPAIDVSPSSKSATLPFTGLPEDEESSAAIRTTGFRVRLTALGEAGEISSAASGVVIESFSDDFFIGEGDEPPEPASERELHLPNLSLARLHAAQVLPGTELTSTLVESGHEFSTHRVATDAGAHLDVSIDTFPALRALVADVLGSSDLRRFSMTLTSSETITADHISGAATDIPADDALRSYAKSRRECLDLLAKAPAGGSSLETIEPRYWIDVLERRVRSLIKAYIEVVTGQDTEAALSAMTADTLDLTIAHKSQQHRAIVLLPTHPLRLAWYLQYVRVLASLEDGLLGLPQKDRRRAIDLDLVRALIPENSPLIAVAADRRPFVHGQSVGHSATVMLDGSDADPHLTKTLLQRALGLHGGSDAIQLPPKALTTKLRLYLATHPHVARLRILAVNGGSGAFLPKALDGLFSGQAEDGEATRLALTIRAVDGSAVTPRPVATIQALQRELHDTDRVTSGSFLSPAVEVSAQPDLASALDDDFNIAIVIDPVSADVAMDGRGSSRTSRVHGLVVPTETSFDVDDAGATWTSHAAVHDSRDPDRHAVELGDLLGAQTTAIARVMGRPGLKACLRVAMGLDEIDRIERLHLRCDWVASVSRYGGSELLDSPADAHLGAKARKYILDFSPDFSDEFGHRMTVSTMQRSELEMLLQNALAELGFGDLELSSTVLLDDLHAISGRLALRLVEGNSFAREAAGLAIVSRLLRQRGNLDDAIVVPVDAHPELFGPTHSAAVNPSGQRCDLLLVRPKARSLEIEFVEVKQRVGAVPDALYQTIAQQTAATERVVEDLFFSPGARLDHRFHRARLAGLLMGYAERSVRYGCLSADALSQITDRLNRLEFAYEGLAARRTGYIVNLNLAPVSSRECDGTTIHVLTEQDLTPTGLRSAQSALTSTARMAPPPDGGSAPLAPPEPAPPHPTGGAHMPQDPGQAQAPAHETGDPARAGHNVEELESSDLAPVSEPPSTIQVPLGTVHGTDTPVEWSISTKGSPHLFMIGMPGQGKSWTILRIVQDFASQALPSLIFDYHGQFAHELDVELPVLDLADGLPFSPFEATAARGASNWKVNAFQVADILAFVGSLGPIQREAVYTALTATYRDHGYTDDAVGELPSVRDFFAELETSERSARSGQNAAARLRPLLDFNLFREQTDDSIARYFKSGAIIDMSGVPIEEVQNAGGAFILRKLYRDMLSWGESDRLRLAVVLDEAHRLARDVTLPKLMKEGRKFGIVVIVASQNNNDFHADVLQNAGSKLVFRLNIGEAKHAAGFVRGRANSDLTPEIENLGVGEAFVQTADMPQARRTELLPYAKAVHPSVK